MPPKWVHVNQPHGVALLLCQAKEAAESLRKFDYPPVGAVSISYPLSAIREDRKDSTGQLPGAPQLHSPQTLPAQAPQTRQPPMSKAAVASTVLARSSCYVHRGYMRRCSLRSP
jgi:hypothetical protein